MMVGVVVVGVVVVAVVKVGVVLVVVVAVSRLLRHTVILGERELHSLGYTRFDGLAPAPKQFLLFQSGWLLAYVSSKGMNAAAESNFNRQRLRMYVFT